MIEFLGNNWKEIAGLIGGLVAAWKYFDTRKRELTWRKTETLFRLGDRFDSDPDISQATQLIDDRLAGLHLNQLFDEEGRPNNDLHGDMLHKIDKHLNLLARMAYAHQTMNTLSLAEVRNFGAYYQNVLVAERLKKYCQKYGYNDVVKMAEKI